MWRLLFSNLFSFRREQARNVISRRKLLFAPLVRPFPSKCGRRYVVILYDANLAKDVCVRGLQACDCAAPIQPKGHQSIPHPSSPFALITPSKKIENCQHFSAYSANGSFQGVGNNSDGYPYLHILSHFESWKSGTNHGYSAAWQMSRFTPTFICRSHSHGPRVPACVLFPPPKLQLCRFKQCCGAAQRGVDNKPVPVSFRPSTRQEPCGDVEPQRSRRTGAGRRK